MALFVESLTGVNVGYNICKGDDIANEFSSLRLLTTDGRQIDQSFYKEHSLTIVIAYADAVDPKHLFSDYSIQGLKKYRRFIGEMIVIGKQVPKSSFDDLEVAQIDENHHDLLELMGISEDGMKTKIMLVHQSGDIIKKMSFDGFDTDVIWHEILMLFSIIFNK